MDCLHPITIKNPLYGTNSFNETNPTLSCPCGKCEACIVSTAQEWRVRLEEEWYNSETSYFVTLTYDDSKIPLVSNPDSFGQLHIVPSVSKRDVQLFFKRLRKFDPDKKIRYYLVSEYGPTTFRPHYHALIFGLPKFSQDPTKQIVETTKLIQKNWSNGFVQVDKVSIGRISYVTKYLSCITDLPEYYTKPFRLMSRNPGIGSSYFNNKERIDWHRNNLACYYPSGQFKMRLPRYFKDRIFDDDMKAEIGQIITEQRLIKQSTDEVIGQQLGYNNYVDYRQSMITKYIHRFDKKLKKQRKDV